MEHIRFEPFVGKNYVDNEFKILVLGESHYLNDKDFEDYLNHEERIKLVTSAVLNEFLEYKRGVNPYCAWMKTFTTFSNVISGCLSSR